MAKRTSSAAWHAANVLFKHYTFTKRPPEQVRMHYVNNLKATREHVAILIDDKTNAKAIAELRTKISYWQRVMAAGINDSHTAGQITYFFNELINALEEVPHFSEEEHPYSVASECLTTTGAWTVRMNLSKAAMDAMEVLYYYFDMQPIDPPMIYNLPVERMKTAKLIDTCVAVCKAVRTLPMLRRGYALLLRGQATPEDVIKCLERIGILFEFLPNFEDHRDETKLLA